MAWKIVVFWSSLASKFRKCGPPSSSLQVGRELYEIVSNTK